MYESTVRQDDRNEPTKDRRDPFGHGRLDKFVNSRHGDIEGRSEMWYTCRR